MSSMRKISPYSTNQGNEGTCWAHSTARLISRLIKSFGLKPGDDYPDEFHDTIMFEEGEILDEYYDTINCSSQHTIFNCIALAQDIHERKGKPFSMHKSLNKVINWESENLSALLFHFIFNSIKNKYGCNGLKISTEKRLESAPIFYFFKLLRRHITEEKIKDILNYSNYQIPPAPPSSPASPEIDLPLGWQVRISRKKYRGYSYWFNTLTGEKTWKDPRGVVPLPSPASPISPLLTNEDKPKKKRVTNGYILFSKSVREEVIAKLTVGDEKPKNTEIMKQQAAMWSELDSDEKAVWNDRAKETNDVIGGGLMVPTFQQVQENKIMFSRLITKLASVFEFFRISLKRKTLKVNMFMSTDLNNFIQINDKLGFRDFGWSEPTIWDEDKKNNTTNKGYTTITTISIKSTWFETITRVLEYGLYVLLTLYGHAILITAIEGEFFIVKNSWGSNRNWSLPNDEQFIVDNKLNISTLIEHSGNTRVVLVFIVSERLEDEIFTEDKLPKKSIIHTLKKTAKRLSACFGMGKKNKTQNKFKKYHKKLSKNVQKNN
jgi:hypothetical protein